MMGDCRGDLEETEFWNADDEDLQKYLRLCAKLVKPLPGTWGNVLDRETFVAILGEEDADWMYERFEIITEKGRDFVTYQGFSLFYYDDKGLKYNAKWVEKKEV
jgi:hypothetical protein